MGAAASVAGVVMMGGAAAGAIGGGIENNSNSKVAQACDEYNEANETYQSYLEEWSNVINNLQAAEVFNTEITQNLVVQASGYQERLQSLKDAFKTRQNATIIGLLLFIFIIILTLLFSYFKIIPRIWKLLTK